MVWVQARPLPGLALHFQNPRCLGHRTASNRGIIFSVFFGFGTRISVSFPVSDLGTIERVSGEIHRDTRACVRAFVSVLVSTLVKDHSQNSTEFQILCHFRRRNRRARLLLSPGNQRRDPPRARTASLVFLFVLCDLRGSLIRDFFSPLETDADAPLRALFPQDDNENKTGKTRRKETKEENN